MRLTVLGAEPRYGSTKGTAMRPIAVSVSIRKRRWPSISARSLSFPASHAEQAVRPHHQHQRHRREQHHVRVAGVDHRCEADDLARDEATEYRAGERSNPADDDDNEGLHEDCL